MPFAHLLAYFCDLSPGISCTLVKCTISRGINHPSTPKGRQMVEWPQQNSYEGPKNPAVAPFGPSHPSLYYTPALLVARGLTVARAVPPYLRSIRTPYACHVMFMVYVRTWWRGRVRACRVVGLPRDPGGCCLCALLTSVPWVGRGLRRTSGRCPPLGPTPGAEV